MARYAVILPTFWSGGETGKRLREITQARGNGDVRCVAMYLMSCRAANMVGMYVLPLTHVATETGLTIETVEECMSILETDLAFCHYDHERETVLVTQMLYHQTWHGAPPQPDDKRVAGARRIASEFVKSSVYKIWWAEYGKYIQEPSPPEGACAPPTPTRSPSEGPSAPPTPTRSPSEGPSEAPQASPSEAPRSPSGAPRSPSEARNSSQSQSVSKQKQEKSQSVSQEGRTPVNPGDSDGRPPTDTDIPLAIHLAEKANACRVPLPIVARELRNHGCLRIVYTLNQLARRLRRPGKKPDDPTSYFVAIAKKPPDHEGGLEAASAELRDLGGEPTNVPLVTARLETISAVARTKAEGRKDA